MDDLHRSVTESEKNIRGISYAEARSKLEKQIQKEELVILIVYVSLMISIVIFAFAGLFQFLFCF